MKKDKIKALENEIIDLRLRLRHITYFLLIMLFIVTIIILSKESNDIKSLKSEIKTLSHKYCENITISEQAVINNQTVYLPESFLPNKLPIFQTTIPITLHCEYDDSKTPSCFFIKIEEVCEIN